MLRDREQSQELVYRLAKHRPSREGLRRGICPHRISITALRVISFGAAPYAHIGMLAGPLHWSRLHVMRRQRQDNGRIPYKGDSIC